MTKYVIVSFLEKNPSATFSSSDWPLHVTIVRPFSSSKNPDYFLDILKTHCLNRKKIILSGKSREMFGHDKSIPVTELEKTAEIEDLYRKLMLSLEGNIEFSKPHFDDFRPHVTDHNRKLGVGDKIALGSLSVVEMDGEKRIVLGTFDFWA